MQSTAPDCARARAYRVRLASSAADLDAAQRLRFEVFNLELNEGLAESWQSFRDADRFDEACDHLLVEHGESGAIVGTYRVQTGPTAVLRHGYYSAQEFDFQPYAAYCAEIVELGRACVHQDHRKMNVLNLLWRGIADYARARNARYLLGCSSLTSQDPALGHAMHRHLAERHLAPEAFRTAPLPAYALPLLETAMEGAADSVTPPRLLRAYLAVGAKICGPPALDREFGTIDFLTLLDLNGIPAAVHNRYFAQP